VFQSHSFLAVDTSNVPHRKN